jgi:membrane carboxypeptidase/penicillin-binding protein PbpC
MFASIKGEVTVTGTAGGSDFQSYSLQVGEGLNPGAWQEIGSGTKPVIDSVLGTWNSGADGLYAIRLVIVHKDQQVSSTVIQVSVDNTPPAVSILYPADGTQIAVDNQPALFFQVDVTENVQVQNITWLIDGVQAARTDAEIRSISWSPKAGIHTLTVEVTDTAGNTGSASVLFSITN